MLGCAILNFGTHHFVRAQFAQTITTLAEQRLPGTVVAVRAGSGFFSLPSLIYPFSPDLLIWGYSCPLYLSFSRLFPVTLFQLFERSEFLIDTPHKKNLRVCPRARVK